MLIRRLIAAALLLLLALPLAARAQLAYSPVTNDGTTGTIVGKLAKFTSAGAAITLLTTDTIWTGLVVGETGASATTGNAILAIHGPATCAYDGATTTGDYVTISSTTAGDCHDTGAATYPTSGAVVGIVTQTLGSAGNASTYLIPPGVQASSGGGGAFSSLTGGTNTAAAMVVGAGASLGTTSTGTNQATTLSNTGPAANSSMVALSGGSHTGSDATADFTLSTAWNTTGAPDTMALHTAVTADGTASAFLDIYGGAAGTTKLFGFGPSTYVPSAGWGIALLGSTFNLIQSQDRGFSFQPGVLEIAGNGSGAYLELDNGGPGGGGGAIIQWVSAHELNINDSLGTTPMQIDLGGVGNAILTNAGAATLHLGAPDAATAVAQTFGVQGVSAGHADTAGANWTIAGSVGTGTGTGGSLIFQVAPKAASTATTQNALVTGLTIADNAAQGTITTVAGSLTNSGIASTAQADVVCTTSAGLLSYQVSATGCAASAMRLKNPKGAIDPDGALQGVMQLRPAVWTYKQADDWGKPHVGLYADDVCAMDDRLCARKAGEVENYDKNGTIAYLVAAVQAQQREIADLKARLERR